MISIVIPIYNQAEKLRFCLDSIKMQTYDNYEIIVVNDGSTDKLKEALKEYQKLFGFKMIVIDQENKGSNPARNRGLARSMGEYLLFCDADIVLDRHMLEKMLNALKENPDASYAYSSFKVGWKTFSLWPFDAQKLKQMPYIHTTSLIRKEYFPGFDEKIKRLQDWDLWLTMLEQGHAGFFINELLFTVKSGGTISNWLPSLVYKLLPFLPSVRKYKQAEKIIKEKHRLTI
jgi:glycosyltransferase involved in cell wall biosynthesis